MLLLTMPNATGSPKTKMAATWTAGSTHISACRSLCNENPSSKSMFLGSGNPLMLLTIVSDISGSLYSKWWPPEPEVRIFSLLGHLAMKFQIKKNMFPGSGNPLMLLQIVSTRKLIYRHFRFGGCHIKLTTPGVVGHLLK